MTSTAENPQFRSYSRDSSIVFLKTAEAFGGLSNMAAGYPLYVNSAKILTSEALYQACRFPHLPEVQQLIIEQKSPMTAKMKSKPHRQCARTDWRVVQLDIMKWCLRVKLAQNWEKFGDLLQSTGNKPIVEESRRDQFWGAVPRGADILVGENWLGRLLTDLRDSLQRQPNDELRAVEPLPIREFLFLGEPITRLVGPTLSDRDEGENSATQLILPL